MTQACFFDVVERLNWLSDIGDKLETYARVVDFEIFRADLVEAMNDSDGCRGDRPAFDPVFGLVLEPLAD